MKYVGKTVFFRIVYGFRIEVYDKNNELILKKEAVEGKNKTVSDAKHYEAIANKVPTSIPQIRREFTRIFSNGASFLSEAAKKYDQPTHYARKIMELRELYDDDILDRYIAEALKTGKLDIKSFRAMLKEHNRNSVSGPVTNESTPGEQTDTASRECSYYEEALREVSA